MMDDERDDRLIAANTALRIEQRTRLKVEAQRDAAETALAAERAKVAKLVEEIKRLTEVIDSTADYLEENHQSQGKPYRWLRAAITEAGQ